MGDSFGWSKATECGVASGDGSGDCCQCLSPPPFCLEIGWVGMIGGNFIFVAKPCWEYYMYWDDRSAIAVTVNSMMSLEN